MHLNILHRPSSDTYRFFVMQQDMAHQLGLKVTVMVPFSAMQDRRIVEGVKRYEREYGDEIGISFHGMGCPDFEREIGYQMGAVWLYSAEDKERIIDLILDKFRTCFGREPISAAAYHFDSSALNILKSKAPSIRIAVAGCFEEGVRVFHGCNNSWYLFNEGMPWGPWYPSRTHSLRPAINEEDSAGLLAVPHLCRDMVLSYEGRNDFWASHPPNVVRAMCNDGKLCPYSLNLVDQYRLQEKYNDGFTYYNVFVGAGWLTHSINSEEPPEVAQSLYREQLAYFAGLRDEGKLTDMTMGRFAKWYTEHFPIGSAHVFWAKDIVYGSNKHYVWYVDSYQRVLLDAAQGGSIGDLRPYVAKVACATGPDSPAMAVGSYPYLIQSQHRAGAAHHSSDGTRTTFLVTHDGETIDLCTCRTKCADIERDAEGIKVRFTPAKLSFASGLCVRFETIYHFPGEGRIIIQRRLIELSDEAASLDVREYVKGCYGTTEYPEDMHGIRLSVRGAAQQDMVYAYRGRKIETGEAVAVSAHIPQIQTQLSLEMVDDCAGYGQAAEGNLFNPFYTLILGKTLKKGGSFKTCLRLSPAK